MFRALIMSVKEIRYSIFTLTLITFRRAFFIDEK